MAKWIKVLTGCVVAVLVFFLNGIEAGEHGRRKTDRIEKSARRFRRRAKATDVTGNCI